MLVPYHLGPEYTGVRILQFDVKESDVNVSVLESERSPV